MQVQEQNQPYDDINVTPMLDLAYVLLVIFIIMTTASVQGVKVQPPKSDRSVSLAKPQIKAITISEKGDLYLDAYPVTMEQLGERVSQLKVVNPGQPIVIKGDARVQYARIMEVMELLKKNEITELGLATQRRN